MHQPQVVFMDVQMPKMNGFELLEALPHQSFWVVFVTSYSEYAIRALKLNALDYLIKPVKTSDFTSIATRIGHLHNQPSAERKLWFTNHQRSLSRLPTELNNPESPTSITVAHAKGLKVIRLSELLYLKAGGSYCSFHLAAETFVASKSMRHFEDLLPKEDFIKVHKSAIVNIRFVKEYIVEDVGYAVMTNSDKLEISRRRKEQFVQTLRNML